MVWTRNAPPTSAHRRITRQRPHADAARTASIPATMLANRRRADEITGRAIQRGRSPTKGPWPRCAAHADAARPVARHHRQRQGPLNVSVSLMAEVVASATAAS